MEKKVQSSKIIFIYKIIFLAFSFLTSWQKLGF